MDRPGAAKNLIIPFPPSRLAANKTAQVSFWFDTASIQIPIGSSRWFYRHPLLLLTQSVLDRGSSSSECGNDGTQVG